MTFTAAFCDKFPNHPASYFKERTISFFNKALERIKRKRYENKRLSKFKGVRLSTDCNDNSACKTLTEDCSKVSDSIISPEVFEEMFTEDDEAEEPEQDTQPNKRSKEEDSNELFEPIYG